MPLFCDLVRLIVGTVDYTPLPREYKALTSNHNHILQTFNAVKTALQRDGVWMQLLKDMVAYVLCAEEEKDFELGADHADWEERFLHKKCWKVLKKREYNELNR
jgi:hypothetical protein